MDTKLKRHDFFQTLYIASVRLNSPATITSALDRLSAYRLDQVSYAWAKESDVFIYYRTQGYNTTRRLHRTGKQTLCVLEEVNSHIDVQHDLMQQELKRLGLGNYSDDLPDHKLRLKAYEEADCILCPSEFVKRSFLAKGFAPERLIKVNFGFPPIEIATAKPPKLDSEPFRILYVGQLHYRKGLRYAIEAFRQLQHPNKEFVIVGAKMAITGLEQTQIPKGVVFTGPLKDEALKEQYRQASVFILPSLEEGLALVQGEALAAGTPLLITTNTGGDDLIKDGVEGFIVPPADATALRERLQQMADDKELLARMSEAALQAAQKLGDWNTAGDQLIAELTTILTARNLV
ncbi:hypothetical protein GCM10028819_51990 [Spirosoma humi]